MKIIILFYENQYILLKPILIWIIKKLIKMIKVFSERQWVHKGRKWATDGPHEIWINAKVEFMVIGIVISDFRATDRKWHYFIDNIVQYLTPHVKIIKKSK